MKVGSSLNKVLVSRIATKGELRICDDMIPCRYNGNDGELMSDAALAARSPDYRFNGKKRSGEGWETVGAWPVYIKSGGECVIPNTPENVAMLGGFKERIKYEIEFTDTGHTQKPVGKLPPLYIRLDVNAESDTPSLQEMSTAEVQKLAASLLTELQKRDKTPTVTPSAGPNDDIASMDKGALEAESGRLESFLLTNAPKDEKKPARERLNLVTAALAQA